MWFKEVVHLASTKEIFDGIQNSLLQDPSKVKFDAVYQFNLEGDDGGIYQVILQNGSARTVAGEELEATCILNMNAEDFKEMAAGNLNGVQAFMSGKLRIQGDMNQAMRLETILR
jgi:putative sterol carrier protein